MRSFKALLLLSLLLTSVSIAYAENVTAQDATNATEGNGTNSTEFSSDSSNSTDYNSTSNGTGTDNSTGNETDETGEDQNQIDQTTSSIEEPSDLPTEIFAEHENASYGTSILKIRYISGGDLLKEADGILTYRWDDVKSRATMKYENGYYYFAFRHPGEYSFEAQMSKDGYQAAEASGTIVVKDKPIVDVDCDRTMVLKSNRTGWYGCEMDLGNTDRLGIEVDFGEANLTELKIFYPDANKILSELSGTAIEVQMKENMNHPRLVIADDSIVYFKIQAERNGSSDVRILTEDGQEMSERISWYTEELPEKSSWLTASFAGAFADYSDADPMELSSSGIWTLYYISFILLSIISLIAGWRSGIFAASFRIPVTTISLLAMQFSSDREAVRTPKTNTTGKGKKLCCTFQILLFVSSFAFAVPLGSELILAPNAGGLDDNFDKGFTETAAGIGTSTCLAEFFDNTTANQIGSFDHTEAATGTNGSARHPMAWKLTSTITGTTTSDLCSYTISGGITPAFSRTHQDTATQTIVLTPGNFTFTGAFIVVVTASACSTVDIDLNCIDVNQQIGSALVGIAPYIKNATPTHPKVNFGRNQETVLTTGALGSGNIRYSNITWNATQGSQFTRGVANITNQTTFLMNMSNTTITAEAGNNLINWTGWASSRGGISRNHQRFTRGSVNSTAFNITKQLNCDAHPQYSAVLNRDSMDDSLENAWYGIYANTIYLWGHCQYINSDNVSSYSVDLNITNPSGAIRATGRRTTGTDGWTTDFVSMVADLPAGNWTVRANTSDSFTNLGTDSDNVTFQHAATDINDPIHIKCPSDTFSNEIVFCDVNLYFLNGTSRTGQNVSWHVFNGSSSSALFSGNATEFSNSEQGTYWLNFTPTFAGVYRIFANVTADLGAGSDTVRTSARIRVRDSYLTAGQNTTIYDTKTNSTAIRQYQLDTNSTLYSISTVTNNTNTNVTAIRQYQLDWNYTFHYWNTTVFPNISAEIDLIQTDLDSLETSLSNNFTQIYNRFSAVDANLSEIDTTLSNLEARIDSNFTDIRNRLSNINTTLVNASANLTNANSTIHSVLSTRFTNIDSDLDYINTSTYNLSSEISSFRTNNTQEHQLTRSNLTSTVNGTLILDAIRLANNTLHNRSDSIDGNLTEIDTVLTAISDRIGNYNATISNNTPIAYTAGTNFTNVIWVESINSTGEARIVYRASNNNTGTNFTGNLSLSNLEIVNSTCFNCSGSDSLNASGSVINFTFTEVRHEGFNLTVRLLREEGKAALDAFLNGTFSNGTVVNGTRNAGITYYGNSTISSLPFTFDVMEAPLGKTLFLSLEILKETLLSEIDEVIAKVDDVRASVGGAGGGSSTTRITQVDLTEVKDKLEELKILVQNATTIGDIEGYKEDLDAIKAQIKEVKDVDITGLAALFSGLESASTVTMLIGLTFLILVAGVFAYLLWRSRDEEWDFNKLIFWKMFGGAGGNSTTDRLMAYSMMMNKKDQSDKMFKLAMMKDMMGGTKLEEKTPAKPEIDKDKLYHEIKSEIKREIIRRLEEG